MPHIVFVAPRFLENTNRYVQAFAELDLELSLVSADPEEAIPAALRPRVAGHYRVADCLDGGQLTRAVRAIAGAVGARSGRSIAWPACWSSCSCRWRRCATRSGSTA
jgi:hypothetical protein